MERNFLEEWIEKDFETRLRLRKAVEGDRIRTRFPPEPNGYLHIGHAKSIFINFGLAKKYGGRCHLRFDDTNPETEETEYVESIKDDVRWLCRVFKFEGEPWGKHLYFASDYFNQLHDWAVYLIERGKAYVDSETSDEIKTKRETGVESRFRDRTVEENLQLFSDMRKGIYAEGEHVLRLKCNMQSCNFEMRDKPIYRIVHKNHHRQGSRWCIYPLYDFAHGQEDAIEGITHSICTLEFEPHRELYDWLLDHLPTKEGQIDFCKGYERPEQREFSRLSLTRFLTSKRKLLKLIEDGVVRGWDDPRMPTLVGLRRRGVTAQAIKNFCDLVGVTKTSSTSIDETMLEDCIREDLEQLPRRLGVLRPLEVELTNLEVEEEIEVDGRFLWLTKKIYIDESDFSLNPPEHFWRLRPGGEVKLRHAHILKYEDSIVKNGKVVKLFCSLVKEEKSGKVIHWVSEKSEVSEFRLFDYLFDVDMNLNEKSEEIVNGRVELNLKGTAFQFERVGYFCLDRDSSEKKLVFNRTIALRESRDKKVGEGTNFRSRKDEQQKQLEEKERRRRIDPKKMFRLETDKYSSFDEDGIPEKDQDGNPLSKSAIKKLRQLQEKQKRLFDKL